MASTKVRGITIELSADASGVVNGLKDVNTSIKTTKSELRDIEKLLKLDPTNTELLAQRYAALDRQVDNTKQKLKELEKAEADLNAQMVDGGTDEQKRQLEALSREIFSTKQELDKYDKLLKEADNNTEDLTKSTKSLTNVEDEAQGATQKLNEGFTIMKGTLSNLIAQGIQAAVSGIKDFAGDMVDVAAELKALDSKFSQTFGELEGQAQSMIEEVGASTGILASRLKDTASNIYAFARSSGASTEEAMQLTETALYAAADGAAYYDRSLEDTADTVQAFLKGNFANDAALGVSATEFTRNAKAVELFGAKYNELTEVQKQQTLLQMVVDSQKLSGAMGQAAREADGWENVQGNLTESWRQFQRAVGTPVLENLIPVLKRVQDKLQELTKKIDWDAFGQKISKAFGALLDGLDWVLDNGDAVISVIEGIGAAMIAIKVSQFLGLGGAITAVAAALIGGATALSAYSQAQTEAFVSSDPLVQKTRELSDAVTSNASDVDKLTSSYESMNQAREDSLSALEAEAAYSETLMEQLNDLVDANGEIKEGEEERAQVLLTQLNGALGTEYEITDGMIDNYDELKQSVYELIEAKKQEAQMAVWNRQLEESTQGLIDAQRELEDISYQQVEATKAYEEAWAAAEEQAKKTGQSTEVWLESFAKNYAPQMYEAVKNSEQALADLDAQYYETKRTGEGFAYSQTQALDNMTAIAEGDFDKIETASYETFQAMGNDSSEYEKAVMENVSLATVGWQEALAEQLATALGAQVEFKEAGNGTVTAYVDGQKLAEGLTQKEAEALADIVEKGMASGDFEGTGMDAVRGFAGGLGNTQLLALVTQRANEMARKAINAAKSTLEIQSPSKVFAEIGEFVGEGLAEGIEDSTKLPVNATKDMAKDVTKAFSTNLTTPNISGGVNSMMNYGVNMQSKDLSAMLGLLQQYLPTLANTQIVMDSGELVGSIAPKMSQQFNKLDTMAIRGTI